MTNIQFTDDRSGITAGEHRDDQGRLAGAEEEYIQQTTGSVRMSPRHSVQDNLGILPSMGQIYSQKWLSLVIVRPDISLVGYKEAAMARWDFIDVRKQGKTT